MVPRKRWYALYTKSRVEKRVAAMLEKNGIEVYLPLQRTMRQWSDRRKIVYEPLFRSYVFVRVGNRDHLIALKIPGVVCYVTIEHKRVPVPDYQIEAVKTFLGEEELTEPIEYFETGTLVEVAYGTLKGLRGKLINAKNHRKLIVQIDAVNQNITLKLPSHLLKKIGKPSK